MLDSILLLLYLLLGLFLLNNAFNYLLVLLFALLTSALSITYNLAYQSWLPDIIPEGMEQKGNAVGSILYPFVTMVVAPLSAWAYARFGVARLFFFVSGLLLLSIWIEAQISYAHSRGTRRGKQNLALIFLSYKTDLLEGLRYFRREKGLRNIGTYMGVTNGCSAGIAQMTQYYFQTRPLLSVVMLGALKTAQMLGRVIGGALQYRFEIRPAKRFAFTKIVYLLYDTIDTVLLFLPYPLMLGLKFLTGGLGTSSAIVRVTAYQNFLPGNMRARAHAIQSLLLAVGMVLSYLLSGLLAEYLSYRVAAVTLGLTQLLAMYLLIVKPGAVNRKIYEASRADKKGKAF